MLDAYLADAAAARPCCFSRGSARKGRPATRGGLRLSAIYTRFAVSEQAREAAVKLDFLRSSSAGQIPRLPLDTAFRACGHSVRAQGNGASARSEYAAILQQLSGADVERAEFRILECGMALGGSPSEMIALKLTDPDVDAERSYALADYYRVAPGRAEMVAAVENAVARAPSSRWAASALFLAGNFYWVQARPRSGFGLLQATGGPISQSRLTR